MAAIAPVTFYQVTEDGAIALTQLGMKHPKSRSLVDWLSMILITRDSRSNAVMVSNSILETVLGCGANTVTTAIKHAEKAGIIGVSRYGTNKVLFINPHTIRMSNLPKNNDKNKKYRMMDITVIIDTKDAIYKSINDTHLIDAFRIDKTGLDTEKDKVMPPLRDSK